jgi:hypothetical protein
MKDTGGPAFPAHHFDLAENEHGMTLRDYFAAMAMQGLLSARNPMLTKIADIVEGAYAMADAMLAERHKQ